MATIIDALIVTLGLDSSNFKKGASEVDKEKDNIVKKTKKGDKEISDSEKNVNKERDKQHKENKQRNKDLVDGLTKLRNETVGFLGLFMAGKGLVSFIKDTIDTNASIERMSQNVGIATSRLAGWGEAARMAGGSTEGMMNSIDKATMAVASMKAGIANSDVLGYFKAGGTDQNAFKDTESFLLAQADLVQNLYNKDPADAMMKARQFMGIDTDTFNLLKQGRAAVLKQVADGEFVANKNKKKGEDAIKAQKELRRFFDELTSVGTNLVTSVLPALNDWFGKNQGNIDKWISTLRGGISDLIPLVKGIGTAFEYVGEAIGNSIGFVVTTIADIDQALTEFYAKYGIGTTASKDSTNKKEYDGKVAALKAKGQTTDTTFDEYNRQKNTQEKLQSYKNMGASWGDSLRSMFGMSSVAGVSTNNVATEINIYANGADASKVGKIVQDNNPSAKVRNNPNTAKAF
jgi:hypothetical protein